MKDGRNGLHDDPASGALIVPELPDLFVYLEALRRHVVGRRLDRVRLLSPFVLRSVDPPLDSLFGLAASGVDRVGKRLVLVFPDDVFLVIHLMIAGRLRWRAPTPGGNPSKTKGNPSPKIVLAAFEFETGTLFLTEASSTKRASMQLVRGTAGLRGLDPGGIEPLVASVAEFRDALTRENHTVKRALTDPRLLSGIGNAYSDEILHAAKLSPLKQTRTLTGEEVSRLYDATRATLDRWIDR